MYRQRTVWLCHKNDLEGKNFTFNTQEEEDAKKAQGWVEHRKALSSPPVAETVSLGETVVVDAPIEDEPVIDPGFSPLKCSFCDFVGKNLNSLRIHKLHKHKVK